MCVTSRRGSGHIATATVLASAALGVSLVTSVYVASRAYLGRGESVQRQSRTLEVKGSARMRLRSDLALWDIRVAGEDRYLEEAYRRLDASTRAVMEFLNARGFPESAVMIGPIATTIHYRKDEKGNETREIASHELARRVHVKSAELEKVEKAAGAVTELVKTGAHVESRAPEFIVTGLADVRVKMIAEATANARERAEAIASGTGCRIAGVREARSGVFQITRPESTEVSGGGVYDTSTIEKDITAVVTVTFLIEPR